MLCIGVIHQKGVSRQTGKEYDFFSIQGVTTSPRCDGYMVDQINISPEEFATSGIGVGTTFIQERDGGVYGVRVTGNPGVPTLKTR